jgi:hypothetical protein
LVPLVLPDLLVLKDQQASRGCKAVQELQAPLVLLVHPVLPE